MFSKVQVSVGGVLVGGSAPVVIQSMTNTRTDDVVATLSQIRAMATAGAELARVAVPDQAAAHAMTELVRRSPLSLIADIHFDYRLAVASLQAGVAAVRINPGNIGARERVRKVVEAAQARDAVIRVGVNSGSLERDLRRLEETDPAAALTESALRNVAMLEEMGFSRMKVSIKSSSPVVTIAANRLLAASVPYPLHVGVTEAGTPWTGSIRNSVALGALLAEGIGDTIRVSLTGDPIEEIRVAREILRSLDLVRGGPRLISCPTCGRTEIALEALARQVEERLAGLDEDLEIAVMGCIVNGPGEARKADFGIAGGRGEGVVFAHGRPVKKVPEDRLVEELFAVIAAARKERAGGTEGGENEGD